MNKRGLPRYTEIIIIITGILAIGFMLLLNVGIFGNYHRNLLNLQEAHMTATAKAVANSLKNYYDESLAHFSVYFEGEMTQEDVQRYYEQQKAVSGIAVTDEQGTALFSCGSEYAEYYVDLIEEYRSKEHKQGILLAPLLTGQRHFTQFMIKEVSPLAGKSRYVIASIEMELIYQQIVEPVKIGENGYSMVKDYSGTILMHKSRNQIGIDAVEGRREQYQEYDLDLDHLESWVEQQKVEQEGSGVLNSYWWEDEGEPEETRKVVAYTQVPVGEEIWIVNCTLDYEEIQKPLEKTRNQVFLLTAGVAMVFGLLLLQVVNNINRRKSMEQEMKHLLQMNEAWEELHKREEQIRHNDKMKTLGTMTSMIAHEFNNFLTPITLYGEMLAGDINISDENRDCLEEIVEAAGKAKELTKELSRYGRTEGYQVRKDVIQVSREIERSLKIVKKTLPDNIELIQELEPDEGFGLLGSSGMINQIVVNLCTNAVHAMHKQGGVLTVKGTLMRDDTAIRYGITIGDTGPGMSDDTMSRIFTPFYTTKEMGQGTGLGLSVVQNLVHQVSGEISVISVEGQGSRFDIILPLFEVTEGTAEQPVSIELDQKSIYIVDDNEHAGKALKRSLKRECHKVRFCTHPEQALAEIRTSLHEWDMIITDYAMPMMNGLEFSGILRSLGYSGIIILISGQLDQEISWYLDNQIIQAALEKPVTVLDIENCINLNKG